MTAALIMYFLLENMDEKMPYIFFLNKHIENFEN